MVSNLTFTLLKFQGSPFLSQCFPMFLTSQDGQYSEGIQLQSQFPIVSCFGCFSLQTAQSCFKRDVSYILSSLSSVMLQKCFSAKSSQPYDQKWKSLILFVTHLHQEFASTALQKLLFIFKVTYDIYLLNLIFIFPDSRCPTSSTFDSLISFFLRKFLFLFYFAAVHYVFYVHCIVYFLCHIFSVILLSLSSFSGHSHQIISLLSLQF